MEAPAGVDRRAQGVQRHFGTLLNRIDPGIADPETVGAQARLGLDDRQGSLENVVCPLVFSQQLEYQCEINRSNVVPVVDPGHFGFE